VKIFLLCFGYKILNASKVYKLIGAFVFHNLTLDQIVFKVKLKGCQQ
jgi:hypothetical protein